MLKMWEREVSADVEVCCLRVPDEILLGGIENSHGIVSARYSAEKEKRPVVLD